MYYCNVRRYQNNNNNINKTKFFSLTLGHVGMGSKRNNHAWDALIT